MKMRFFSSTTRVVFLIGGVMALGLIFIIFSRPTSSQNLGNEAQLRDGIQRSTRRVGDRNSSRTSKEVSADAKAALKSHILSAVGYPRETFRESLDRLKKFDEWVSQLNKDDCAELVKMLKADSFRISLLEKVYRRYGELAHIDFLEEINSGPLDSYERRLALQLCLEGWSRVDPQAAWQYTQKESKVSSPKSKIMFGAVLGILKNWAKLDESAAFRQIKEFPSNEQPFLLRGYVQGISGKSNMRDISARVSDSLRKGMDLSKLHPAHAKMIFEGHSDIQIELAAKWMNSNTKEATEWLRSEIPGPKLLDSKSPLKTEEDPELTEAHYLGKLAAQIAQEDNEDQTNNAISWIEGNTTLLQDQNFQNAALTTIAKYSPDRALTLIRKIDSKDRQAEILNQMVAPSGELTKSMSGFEYVFPDAPLTYEAVQSELKTGRFSDSQVALIQKGLTQRVERDQTPE